MQFTPLDLAAYPRREHFQHYLNEVPCSYSMTVQLEITPLLHTGYKLYPTLIHCISRAVNGNDAFKLGLDSAGRPGLYDAVFPNYTIFHQATKTFSSLWTEYHEEFSQFHRAYSRDLSQYGDDPAFSPKPPIPNQFYLSAIPWVNFQSFQLTISGPPTLAPIFTLGRYSESGGRTFLPLALQVHHAACDGYHAAQFVTALQELILNFSA